jgi:hypothetical protein
MIFVTLTIAVRVAASMNYAFRQCTTLSAYTEQDVRHSCWNRQLGRRMPVPRLAHAP